MAKRVKTPWYNFYDGVKEHLDYPNTSIYKLLETTANKHLDYIRVNYINVMGADKYIYERFWKKHI